ncbi:RrF2 family transcriptional regulator [Plastoroseomonas arctica]|uniref:Transcriptional regulator n=1 Tax=Plastoroseomonas arctica TaxID=1509237 RepID=A0AAF1JVA2_9PROT|nr:Rrf2 family transcriptional regulator [Plastoroseomonas arctica]MBR0654466.1 transcriptional regulator [Plastoroseomonas arctica]
MLIRHDRALLALDILLDVAFHAGRGTAVTGAADIAERLGLARRGIEPALQALVRGGLLESLRGPRGGYRLGRAPRAITLLDAAMAYADEDPAEPGASGSLSLAVVQPLWKELDAALRERLSALTISDLLQRAAAKGLRRPITEPLNFAI